MQALNPSRTYRQLPNKYNMKYEVKETTTSDGAKLKIWYFPAKTGKTTKLILISHNGEGNMGDYLRRVDQFITAGFNVVTYDYRGFGESSEFEIDNNMFIYPHFIKDYQAMLDFCRKNYVQTFDVYGWGIGGGLSLGIGYNRREVNSIIADTPFLSMEDLEDKFGEWDEPLEVPFAGYDKKFEPLHALDAPPTVLKGHVKKVKLIIGSNDPLMKLEDMKKLQAKQKTIVDAKIHVVQNPDRKDNFLVDKSAYFTVVKSFLKSK